MECECGEAIGLVAVEEDAMLQVLMQITTPVPTPMTMTNK